MPENGGEAVGNHRCVSGSGWFVWHVDGFGIEESDERAKWQKKRERR